MGDEEVIELTQQLEARKQGQQDAEYRRLLDEGWSDYEARGMAYEEPRDVREEYARFRHAAEFCLARELFISGFRALTWEKRPHLHEKYLKMAREKLNARFLIAEKK